MKIFGYEFGRKPEPIILNLENNDKSEDKSFNFELNIVDDSIKEERFVYTIREVIKWGVDNLMPDRFAQLYKNSPIHSSIINYKRDYLSTNWFFDTEKLSIREEVEFNIFKNSLISVGDFEDFDDFIRNLSQELLIFGNIFIKVVKDQSGKITKIKILPSHRMRVTGDIQTFEITGYAYCNDWINKQSYIPLKKFKLGDREPGESVLLYQKKSPDYKFYGTPEWFPAYDAIELLANVPYLHKQNILNGINMSGILTIYDYPNGEEEKRNFTRSLQSSLQGVRKTGGLFITAGSSKELAPDYKRIAPDSIDKQFINLLDDMEKMVCYAHQIAPAVLGIPTPGKLGANQEIEFLTAKFEESMNSEKKVISDIMNKLLDITGNTKVRFNYIKEDLKNDYLEE